MILVVGATGMLGTAVCTRLATEGYAVRALVRPRSDARVLTRLGVEVVPGDLRSADSVRQAVARVDAVVSTACAAANDRTAGIDEVEGDGYFNLLRACQRNTIDRLVFVSVPVTPYDELVPTYRYKRINERRVRKSGVPFTIVRSAPFMEHWFPLLGTSVPLRGLEPTVVRRRYWGARLYGALSGRLMEAGAAVVPGHGLTRHAFVAVPDVAAFVVEALFRDDAEDGLYQLGGPQVLSWNEVVDTCQRALGRKLIRVRVPPSAFRLQQLALRRVSPRAANLMGRTWIQSQWDTLYEPGQARPVLDTRDLTTVEQFFRRRLALPRTLRAGVALRGSPARP